jgi:hypothetical protein
VLLPKDAEALVLARGVRQLSGHYVPSMRYARLLIDALAFFAGYALISRKLTGGGIVDPQIITRGAEPTYTVVASVLAGLLGVAVWRVAYVLIAALLARSQRRR